MRSLKTRSVVLALFMVLLMAPAAFASHVPLPDITPEPFTFDPGALGLCFPATTTSCPFTAFVKGIFHTETTVVPGPAGTTVAFTETGTVTISGFLADPNDPTSLISPVTTGLGITYGITETFTASGFATLTPDGIDVTFTSFSATASLVPAPLSPVGFTTTVFGTATGLPGVTGESHVGATLAAGSFALIGAFTPTSPFVVDAGDFVEVSGDVALVGLAGLVGPGGIQPGSFTASGGGTQFFGQIVPQPASLLMLGVGLIGMAAWSWRRRKA